MISETIFLDVDTQWDLVMPDGAWPAPSAFGLMPNFERLTRYAATYKIRVVSTMQLLTPADSRFTGNGGELPPHCLADTPGARKVPATQPNQPVVIPNRELSAAELKSLAVEAREIILETAGPDPLSNPNAANLLAGVRTVIVFGVGGEGAVMAAIRTLRGRNLPVDVVQNAVALRTAEPEAVERWQDEVRALGAKLIRDLDVMSRFTTARHH